jgi:hypothetical protein
VNATMLSSGGIVVTATIAVEINNSSKTMTEVEQDEEYKNDISFNLDWLSFIINYNCKTGLINVYLFYNNAR